MNVWLDTRLRAGARRCGVLLMCMLFLCVARPPYAAAEPGSDAARDASARELFEQGLALAERGDWASAEDRFRRALSLRSSPVIAYNLASALCEQGKLVEASELLHRVLADEKTEHALRQTALQLQSGIAPRIGRIQIIVESKAADDSVLLDGRLLYAAQLNVDIPADPGSHQLQLERAGQTLDMQTVQIEPGGRRQARLTAPPLTAAAQVAAPEAGTAAPGLDPGHKRDRLDGAALGGAHGRDGQRDEGSSLLTRWWFWTGVVAIVGVGTLVGFAASGGGSHADSTYHGSLGPGSVQVQVEGAK